jgi:cobalt-zinc-cadmium efflux system membrane fusion protein
MKYPLAIVVLSACAACSRGNAMPKVESDQNVTATPGTVVMAADSPLLKQIRREQVRTADLPTNEVIAPGKIEVNPNRVSKVVLPVAGRIVTVLVRMGDAVSKNQALLTMQSPDADAAMSTFLSADAAVTQAHAALVKAQADFDRSSDLLEHDAIAKKDVVTAESALTQATAGVQQAEAARQQGLRRLTMLGLTPGGFEQRVVLRSPLAGRVLELSVVPGEFRNDTSAGVMTIADLSVVWVTSQVPESAIRFIHAGERVDISLVAYPGETLHGRVSRIADTVDPQTRTIKVQAELDNASGRFRPEMYGSIHHVESIAALPVVPVSAVVQDGDRTVVFLEGAPGHFEERVVSIGTRAGNIVPIVTGVKPGDSVVVDGVMLLKGLVKSTS